jgi:hypothetical protein
MIDPLPTFTDEELERYWGELDKLDCLDYALFLRRTMIDLTALLGCSIEKIVGRVEELIDEVEALKLQVWSQTRG